MSLSELSDYEINKLVVEVLYPDTEEVIRTIGKDSLMVTHWVSGCLNMTDCLDYCNDDALAFRLMIDNNICATWEDEGFQWCASEILEIYIPEYETGSVEYGCYSDHKSLNRAIAECFIIMNQGGDK